jgi:ABC-2 type transport system ATP-binding protein
VVFIKDGEVVATRDLRAAPRTEVRVVVHARKVSEEAMTRLTQWTTATHLEAERLSFSVSSTEVLPQVIRHLVISGAEVFGVTPQRASLEDLFVSIMGEDRGL